MKTLIIVGGSVIAFMGLFLILFAVISREHKKPKKKHDAGDIDLSDKNLESDIILNAIEDGVILIDAHNNIRVFNPAASRIIGWPAKEAVGLDFNLVVKLIDEKGNAYQPEVNPLVQVFTQKTTIRDHSAMLLTRSNKRTAVNLSVSPLFDKQGNVNGSVTIFRDVSKERGEERQRAEFISTASHEMRTPVAAIEGYLALAMNEKVTTIDTKARDYLQKAHLSTQHLGQLFQDLLTSAKAEDGRLSSHPVVIEMGQFLEKLADDLRFTAQKKNLSMEFVMGTNNQTIDASGSQSTKMVKPLYYVHADPDRLREVITNLFDNAVKYTDTGKISLGMTGNNEVVQFYVKDTGPGIPPEDISHLFEKFYRVDNSATRTIGGTGLGLFISRKIVELYGGRIWVESDLGKGSTFFVNLPRITNQKASELKATEAQASPLSSDTPVASS